MTQPTNDGQTFPVLGEVFVGSNPKPLPTHDEVIAWIDKKIKVAQANIEIYKTENARAVMWLEEFPNSGTGKFYLERTRFMLQDYKERLAQSLANRDVLVRQPEVWVNGTDAGYYGMVGRNQMLIELQAGILQRIAEVM